MFQGPDKKPPGSPPPSSSLAKSAETIQGPVEAEHSRLGKVSKVEAQPKLAGKYLGEHLEKKSTSDWLLSFLKHPKSTFDLLTGRLAKMRDDNPVQYMEGLCDLASTRSDWTFVANEGHKLKQGASTENISRIDGWQNIAFVGYVKSEALKPSLGEILNFVENNSINLVDTGRHSEPGTTLFQLKVIIVFQSRGMEYETLVRVETQLSALDDYINPPGNNAISSALALVKERLDQMDTQDEKPELAEKLLEATVYKKAIEDDRLEDTCSDKPDTVEFQKGRIFDAGQITVSAPKAPDLETIDENNFTSTELYKELEAVFTRLRANLDSEEDWQTFDEIIAVARDELSESSVESEVKGLLSILQASAPDHPEINRRLKP